MGVLQNRTSFSRSVHNTILTLKQGERLKPLYVQPRVKPTRHSQMFWGAISFQLRTSLYPLLGDPNSARGGISGRCILKYLQKQLPTIVSPGLIFAQDNAPTHRAHIVQNWLSKWAEENGLKLIDWPPYSPNLNPIENLWKLLKEEICKRYPELSIMPKNNQSLQRLCEAAIEVWEEFHDDLLKKLISSMPRRLAAVITAQGWYTKY